MRIGPRADNNQDYDSPHVIREEPLEESQDLLLRSTGLDELKRKPNKKHPSNNRRMSSG